MEDLPPTPKPVGEAMLKILTAIEELEAAARDAKLPAIAQPLKDAYDQVAERLR
jgi:hypothetical protein